MSSDAKSDEDEEISTEEEIVTTEFYRDDPEWKDVQPIPQDDGPTPVVRIAYTDKFNDVYGYMRAVLKSGEKSERVLRLTSDAIDCNAANYTVWHYRREVLKAINGDLNEELSFTALIIIDEPKNYQVWYHRQKIVELLGEYSKDLELTEKVLADDNKNYHAWQHRQWIIRTFDLWDSELAFVEKFLQLDLRNNSAWNQRFFVLSRANTVKLTDDVVHQEMIYVIKYIEKAMQNESSWNYLHGVLRGRKLKDQPLFTEMVARHQSDPIPSPFLLSAIVDMCEEKMDEGDQSEDTLSKAKELCELLGTKVDMIRKNYWEYTARRLARKHATAAGQHDRKHQ